MPDPTAAPGDLPDTWFIGLDSWVLQDGNYTDFAVGQRRQFALEFSYDRNQRLVTTDDRTPRVNYLGGFDQYLVTGHLLTHDTEPGRGLFAIDFGLLAYSTWVVLDDLEPPPAGTWLHGGIRLSVDPFFYMDERQRSTGLPPMIYTWQIEELQESTTPTIRVEYGHPLYRGPDEGPMNVADPTRESWRTIGSTKTWDDHAYYRLICVLESHEPATSMTPTNHPGHAHGPLPAR